MEVPPMTRTEAVKEFFKKAVLPVAIAGLLYCIFKSACMRDGELDFLWLWILCGPALRPSIGCACGSCRAGAPWAAAPRCSC